MVKEIKEMCQLVSTSFSMFQTGEKEKPAICPSPLEASGHLNVAFT